MSWVRRKLRGAMLVAGLLALRLCLRLLGLRRTRRLIRRLAPAPPEAGALLTVADAHRTARRVAHAARWARANCLPRSLLLHALLARSGAPVFLRIGIDRERRGALAHAWVEWEETVLGDDPAVRARYAVLGNDQEDLDVAWVGAGPPAPRGRGAASNPKGRFERLEIEPALEHLEETARVGEPEPAPATELLRDASRTILAHNRSPDVGFDTSINPYRGCEHGCSYCYARPTHEHLGFSAGLDFETKIVVKENAAELLRRELGSSRYRPTVIGMSGVTDPYQPVERRLRLTRACLEVLAEHCNPVQVITKNALVTRDLDLLAELASVEAAHVMLSITTLDVELTRRLEPRTSSPANRLEALRRLSGHGIPCGVLIAPVIPALNDHEIPAILEAAKDAGATNAGFVMLRLPHGVDGLFESWLERHAPGRKQRVLNRLLELGGGERRYDSRYFVRQRGHGPMAEQTRQLFALHRKRLGLCARAVTLSTAAFRRPGGVQLELL